MASRSRRSLSSRDGWRSRSRAVRYPPQPLARQDLDPLAQLTIVVDPHQVGRGLEALAHGLVDLSEEEVDLGRVAVTFPCLEEYREGRVVVALFEEGAPLLHVRVQPAFRPLQAEARWVVEGTLARGG